MKVNKKVVSIATAATMLLGTASFAAVPESSVVLGNDGYSVDLLFGTDYLEDINTSLAGAGDALYYNLGQGWKDIFTDTAVTEAQIADWPEIEYVKADGSTVTYAAGNGDEVVDTELSVKEIKAINKTAIKVEFSEAVTVAAGNFELSSGSIDTVTMESATTAVLGVRDLNFGEAVTVTVTGVEGLDDYSKEVTMPTANEIYELEITTDDENRTILSDGAHTAMLTAKLKDRATGEEVKIDGDVEFVASKGSLSQKVVSFENGEASVQLTSIASDTSVVSYITAMVVSAPGASDYEGIKNEAEFIMTFSPDASEDTTTTFVSLVSAESNQADRFFVTFSDDIDAIEYKAALMDNAGVVTWPSNGLLSGIEIDGQEVTVSDVLQKSDKVLEFILETDDAVPATVEITDGWAGATKAYLRDNEQHEIEVPANIGEIVLKTDEKQFVVTDATKPSVFNVKSENQLKIIVEFSEAMAEDIVEDINGNGVNEHFKIDGKEVIVNPAPTSQQVYDAKTNNRMIANSIDVGEYVGGKDNRKLVTIELDSSFAMDAGTYPIQITNVGDWAAMSDDNNYLETQTKTFTVEPDTSRPMPELVLDSPEQWVVKFDEDVILKSTTDKAFEIHLGDATASKPATKLVEGTDYNVTPITVDGNDAFLFEMLEDWTQYYNTQASGENYWNSTKNPIKVTVKADQVRDNLGNYALEKDFEKTIDMDAVSPQVESAQDLYVVDPDNGAYGVVATNTGQFVLVTMDEPVQVKDENGNTSTLGVNGLTPSQQQDLDDGALDDDKTDDAGVPEPTFEFVKGDETIQGNIAAGAIQNRDFEFVVRPEKTLSAGTWTLYTRSISDDVGNTVPTMATTVEVPEAQALEGDTQIAWAAYDEADAAGEGFDRVYIKFTREMKSTGADGVATTVNYYFNGVELPTVGGVNSYVQKGIEGVTDGWDGVTLFMPTGAWSGQNDANYTAALQVPSNFKSVDGEIMAGPYEVELKHVHADDAQILDLGDTGNVFEAAWINETLDGQGLVGEEEVVNVDKIVQDTDMDGQIDSITIELDNPAGPITPDTEFVVNGVEWTDNAAAANNTVVLTAGNDADEVSFVGGSVDVDVTSSNGNILATMNDYGYEIDTDADFFGGNVEGPVVITGDDITVENMNVTNNNGNGNVYVNPGADGTVTLKSVTADNLVILSGAVKSIHLEDVKITGNVRVMSDEDIRVEFKGTTAIGGDLVLDVPAKLDFTDTTTVGGDLKVNVTGVEGTDGNNLTVTGALVVKEDVDTDSNEIFGASQPSYGTAPAVNTQPVITVVEADGVNDGEITLTVGDVYVESTYTATDAEDGDVTADVVVGGDVDTSVAGTYTVTYDVVDSEGLAADTVTVTVTVEEAAGAAVSIVKGTETSVGAYKFFPITATFENLEGAAEYEVVYTLLDTEQTTAKVAVGTETEKAAFGDSVTINVYDAEGNLLETFADEAL